MGVMRAKRLDPDFQKLLRKHAKVDPRTGKVEFDNVYASLSVNICFKGTVVSCSYASLVWFLTKGKWPREGYHLDHVDDDSLNNAPSNLQELTQKENQAKRRGRKIYRSYGTGKYGHGFGVHSDKRDGRHYVSRNVSRGLTKGKSMKVPHGGFASLLEAETYIKKQIKLL